MVKRNTSSSLLRLRCFDGDSTHFVADHFSPLVVGQLPCRECLSSTPSGVRLRGYQGSSGSNGSSRTGPSEKHCGSS
jgi:hypothetical protein